MTTKTPTLLEGRRRMTDEEFIDAAKPASEDDWKRTMRTRYGFDWS